MIEFFQRIFESLISNLIANILCSAFGIGLSLLIRFLIIIVPNRLLWKIKDPKNFEICVATSSTTTSIDGYVRPSTGIGQVRSLGLSLKTLTKAYKDLDFQNVLLSEDHFTDRIGKDMLILGGPKTNKHAEKILLKIRGLQPADEIGSIIYWKEKKQLRLSYESKINVDTGYDYGLAFRMVNPFNPKRTVIMFCGGHTYGTIVAAQFFVEHKWIFTLKHLFKKNIVVLVKADIINGHPNNIKLIKEYAW